MDSFCCSNLGIATGTKQGCQATPEKIPLPTNLFSGDVRVYYDIKLGSVSPLSSNLELAAPESDFEPAVGGYILIRNGENSGNIVVTIKEDDVPEVDEAFVVQITQLQLLSGATTNFRPRHGEFQFRLFTFPV